jgi:hypothetical protein
VLAYLLDIVDPLALDVRSTDDKDPILDIVPILQDECATTRLELYLYIQVTVNRQNLIRHWDAGYRSGIPVTWYYQSSPLGCFSEFDRLEGVQYSCAYQPSWNYGTGEMGTCIHEGDSTDTWIRKLSGSNL